MEHIVLLVDDDKNVVHGLTRALRCQPYQIYTAQSGDEAMWILKSHDVDVIVTDEKMPGMSGCDLIAWVAEHYPQVVRILLTGHASTETALRAINEGAVYQIFTKPCRDLHLAVAIRKALEHRELVKENFRLRGLSQQGNGVPQRLGQDLETLVRVVSHDLREPLQAISDFCRSPAEQGQEGSDLNVPALLDGALSAAAEAERLATGLLESCSTQRSMGPTSQSNSDGDCVAGLPQIPAGTGNGVIQPDPPPDGPPFAQAPALSD
jgi:FixJ family two-component response regulator